MSNFLLLPTLTVTVEPRQFVLNKHFISLQQPQPPKQPQQPQQQQRQQQHFMKVAAANQTAALGEKFLLFYKYFIPLKNWKNANFPCFKWAGLKIVPYQTSLPKKEAKQQCKQGDL